MIRKVGKKMKRKKFDAILGTVFISCIMSFTAFASEFDILTDSGSGENVFTDDSIRKDDSVDEALEQYRTVIANAANYDFGDYTSPEGTYQYALEYMKSDDPNPSLLLRQCGTRGLDYIRVFYYDPSTGSLIAPGETLTEGVAGAGGFRGGIGMMEDGDGICFFAASSGTGELSTSRVTLNGDILVTEVIWTGILGQEDPAQPKNREIIWYDTSDFSGFDNLSAPSSGDETSSLTEETDAAAEENPNADEVSAWTAGEQAAGRTVLTGIIRSYNYDEVIVLQGVPDPNAPYTDKSRTYTVITLDQPQIVNGMDIDGHREDEVSMIKVFDQGSGPYAVPADLNGQSITFSISADTFYWPSDTGLPLGVPSTNDIHIFSQGNGQGAVA